MNKKSLYLIIASVLIIVIAVIVFKGDKAPDSTQEKEEKAQEAVYTMEEVTKHNTRDDCWMVINGSVYDVTKFIISHPGGPAILQGCGKDATELFETRPMGSGTPHSERARKLREKYKIGRLAE